MYFSQKLQVKLTSLALLVSVLFLSFFAIFFCSEMMMSMGNMETKMSAVCDSMAGKNLNCPMDINEHLNAWSQLLAAVLASGLAFLVLTIIWVCLGALNLNKKETEISNKYYLRNHGRFKLFAYFTRLFARGIVQPKIFA